MPSIAFSGTMPATLMEDSHSHGWAGALSIGINPALVNFIDLVGSADVYLDSSFDRSTGTVLLWNTGTPDYESFVRLGLAPVIQFQLRVFLADGTRALSTDTYSLAVGDADDTPPTALAFTSGGTVAPGAIGATIGTLAVTDPDSAGPFSFIIDPADAWQYEVVGTTLKLKPGMTVAISDGPFRALTIEVSDGLQSSAQRLEIAVVAGPGEQAVLDVLDPWEVRSGFSWKNADTITALRGAWEIDHLDFYGTTVLDVTMKDGSHVWLPRVARIEFLNGALDMREHGSADTANAAYHTILGRLVDRGSLWSLTNAMDAGTFTLDGMISFLLGSGEFAARYGVLNNDQFIRLMYRNTEGGAPNEGSVQYWKGTLDAGASRASVAKAFVTWEVTRDLIDTLHPNGWWLERPQAAALASAYDVALDRLPDRGGFDYWMGVIEAGLVGLNNIAVLFGRSEEFTGRNAGRTTQEFVRELYRTALDREPDQSGFDFWVNALDTGILARHNMIYAFGFSDEKLADFAALPPGEPFGLG